MSPKESVNDNVVELKAETVTLKLSPKYKAFLVAALESAKVNYAGFLKRAKKDGKEVTLPPPDFQRMAQVAFEVGIENQLHAHVCPLEEDE